MTLIFGMESQKNRENHKIFLHAKMSCFTVWILYKHADTILLYPPVKC